MATYDLERWSRWIRKRYPGEPSLTLHLHQHHCRFEHQNGVFLYDSPIRNLLESIRDARLPVELLDLLDATAVKYYDGCLVVEVVDHRGLVDQDGTLDNGLPAGAEGSAVGAHSRQGSTVGNLDGRRGSRTVSSARGTDGSILKPSVSLSMNDANDPNTAIFQKRFMLSYKRFELALQEAAAMKASQIHKDRKVAEQKKQRLPPQQQQHHQDNSITTSTDKHAEQNKENGSLHASSIHSAIAAAVATAPVGPSGAASEDDTARARPLIYRLTLGPDIETIWTDLCAMREEKRAKWSEEDMLAIESRILALTTPPLCLSPDMQVSRIANTLLDATSLPVTPAIPGRKREAALHPTKASTKFVKKAKLGTDKAEKEAAEMQEQEEEERAKVEAQESADQQEEEAWMRVMDESQASRLAFQPSFSRLAFVQNWREKKTEEEERVTRLAAEAAEAQGQAEADARAAAQAAKIASRNASRQGSVQQSRQGSVVDIPVNAPTPANNSFSGTKSEDISMETQAAQSLPKKKKLNKNKDRTAVGGAGSPPNLGTSVNDLGASVSSGSLSLKLTLPAKNKKKDKNASKAGSPDIAVNPSPPPSTAGTPISMLLPNNNTTSTPTAAQQAIMRKTAALPKAKLKSDIKAQAQVAAAAQAAQQNQVSGGVVQQNAKANDSPASQQGTPQMQNQLPHISQQPIRPSSTNPHMNLPIQPQRNFVSPIQNNQQNAAQFPSAQSGGPLAGIQPGQPMNVEQTQEYVNQLQAQIASYQQQQNQSGANMNFNSSSGPSYNQNMQIPNQQQQHHMSQGQFPVQPPQGSNTAPTPQNFANIHRSPMYSNATLPQQQVPGMQTPQPQHQFIPYNNSASPQNVTGVPQGTQFTPQQAFQLQQLQQSQQNMFSQHTQALANFGQRSNTLQNNNVNFNLGSYTAQQGQQPVGQQAMQNMSNMPNVNLQNMQMNGQFNPALLNQLQRQQQSQQQPMGMQGFNGVQNQWQGQQ